MGVILERKVQQNEEKLIWGTFNQHKLEVWQHIWVLANLTKESLKLRAEMGVNFNWCYLPSPLVFPVVCSHFREMSVGRSDNCIPL